MDGLEPSRFMVKKQTYLIDEEYKKLIILRDQQKPFIAEKESELKIVDTEYIEIHEDETLEYLGYNPEDNNYEIDDEPIDKAEAKLSFQKNVINHLYAKRIEGGSEPLLNNEVFVNELIRKVGGEPNAFLPLGKPEKTIKKIMKEYKICENIFDQMETAIAEEFSP